MFRDGWFPVVNPFACNRKGIHLLFSCSWWYTLALDIQTTVGEVVAEDSSQDKWISQLWLRQGVYAPTAPDGNLHSEAVFATIALVTKAS
jgi:hypothetical protein